MRTQDGLLGGLQGRDGSMGWASQVTSAIRLLLLVRHYIGGMSENELA